MTDAQTSATAAGAQDEPSFLNTKYWPATFEERGVVVPFTTPMLAFSRARGDGNDGLEIIVPGLSGGSGVYIIAWPSVRDVFRMTVHDRAFHDMIETRKATTPGQMRRCAHEIAITGLSGADGIDAAEKAIAQEENERLLTNYFLVNTAVKSLATADVQLSIAELSSAKGQKKVRAIMSSIAADLKLSSEQLYGDLEKWSDMIAPIGIAAMPHECRLRRLLSRLKAFRMNLTTWGKRSNADPDGLSFLAADVSALTIDIAETLIGETDDYANDLRGALAGWKTTGQEIAGRMNRISWLLDGWDHVLSIWDEVLDAPIHEQVTALEEIVRMLPLVPTKELEAQKGKAWGELENAMRKFVKPLQDWQSGETDIELMLRVESRRAKAMNDKS
jgi:hypothetical protein